MDDAERAHPLPQPLTLALNNNPNHNNPTNPATGGAARDECWSEGATNTLIEAWGDRYLELNRGNLKQKHWREVAEAVNARAAGQRPRKTDVQCKNRLDTLKKKYKVEKAKVLSGCLSSSSWPFYCRLDDLIGPSRKHQGAKPQQVQVHCPVPSPLPPQPLLVPQPLPLRQCLPEVGEGFDPGTSGSPDTTESCSVPAGKSGGGGGGGGGKKRSRSPESENPLKEVALAITRFGEVYERIENAKQKQMMELEKQRMEFTRDLEIQRFQFFMQAQIELAKLEHAKNGSTEHYL